MGIDVAGGVLSGIESIQDPVLKDTGPVDHHDSCRVDPDCFVRRDEE